MKEVLILQLELCKKDEQIAALLQEVAQWRANAVKAQLAELEEAAKED